MRALAPAALLAAVLLAAAPASGQVADRLADLRLATAVRLALVEETQTRALDVAVAARDGVVTVTGEVPAALQPVAADVARGVPGVRGVRGLGAGPAVADQPRAAPPREPARPPASDAGPVVHTVEAGDTMFSLARRYGTTVQALLDLNGLDAPDLRVGQRLRVR